MAPGTVRAAHSAPSYSGPVIPDEPGGADEAGGETGTGSGSGEDVEALHETVEELRRENEALRTGDDGGASGKGPGRIRRVFAWALVVVACILAVVSVVVVFGRNQLLNTDTYVSTVAPLASNPAIQNQVATKVSEQLIARTDLQARVKNALPARASFLVTPITTEVQSATRSIALKLVQSEEFQKLWVAVNRASHKQLVAVLTGSSQGAVSTKGGRVTVDLTQVEIKLKEKLDGKGITVFDKVPPVKGLNLVLFQSDQLVRFQRLTRFLNRLAVVLPILTLLLFAAGVTLTRNRRRGLIRATAGLALSMGLLLVVISVGRNQYLSGLDPSQSRAANAAVIDTVSAPLQDTARTIAIIAALVAIVAVLAGIPAVRRWASTRRRPAWLTEGPFHAFVAAHRRGLQWSVLVVGLFVLVVWNKPTTLVAVVAVLVTLAVIGVIGLLAGNRSARTAAVSASGATKPR